MGEHTTPENASIEAVDAFDDIEELPESVDRAAVQRMQVVAKLLDESVRVPGTDFRVGVDPILGLLPVGGDLLGGALSLYIVAESARLGVPFTTLLRMLANVSLDVAVGSIPYLGDAFDVFWKANKRNLRLAMRELLTEPEPTADDGVEIHVE